MKYILLLFSIGLIGCAAVRREPLPNTHIWIAKFNERSLEVSDVRQITLGKGYNNQPCFSNDSKYLLYASDQDGNGSPDVMRHDLSTGSTTRITSTTASEFSPTPTSDGRFTAIHVAKPNAEGEEYTESQELWEYDSVGKGLGRIIPATRVGYHAWLDQNHVAVFIVGNEDAKAPHKLVVYNTVDSTKLDVAANIGRCIKRAPNGMLTYVDKSDTTAYKIIATAGDSQSSDTLVTLPKGTEDFCWMYEGTIFTFANGTLYGCTTYNQPRTWKAFVSPYVDGVISRLVMSPDSKYFAWVVKKSSE
jgi:hypothetical protein